jgi:hypothetical protein
MAGVGVGAAAGKMPAGTAAEREVVPDVRQTSVLIYPVCGICSRHIKKGESHWGIQHGIHWVYAEHEDCP